MSVGELLGQKECRDAGGPCDGDAVASGGPLSGDTICDRPGELNALELEAIRDVTRRLELAQRVGLLPRCAAFCISPADGRAAPLKPDKGVAAGQAVAACGRSLTVDRHLLAVMGWTVTGGRGGRSGSRGLSGSWRCRAGGVGWEAASGVPICFGDTRLDYSLTVMIVHPMARKSSPLLPAGERRGRPPGLSSARTLKSGVAVGSSPWPGIWTKLRIGNASDKPVSPWPAVADMFGLSSVASGQCVVSPPRVGAASPLANKSAIVFSGTPRRSMAVWRGLRNAGSRTDSGAIFL
jgi:hypothetical protein